MDTEIRYSHDLEQMSRDAAEFIGEWALRIVRARSVFTMVLSGGKTPRRLYRDLTSPPLIDAMPWGHTHFFWGDERCVDPGSSDSNYAMAQEALLGRAPIPLENVHRMPAELDPPDRAAAEYEQTLRQFFSIPKSSALAPFPCFDLILLGMGADGHTASLFPGDAVLGENTRWVASVKGLAGEPPVPRITLTLPVLNAAACVMFLVTGEEKKKVFQTIWNNPDNARSDYPAARIKPTGRLIWFTDFRRNS